MQEAFHWIVGVFRKCDVPFVVSGGLAAHSYGSPRPVRDFDFDIEESGFEEILQDVEPYITEPLHRHKSRAFENTLMKLNYKGQDIDIASATNAKIFNANTGEWEDDRTDLDRHEIREVFGLEVPVAAREDIITYKSKHPRPEDLIDIQVLKNPAA